MTPLEKLAEHKRLHGKPVRVRQSKYSPHQNTQECLRRMQQIGLAGPVYSYEPPATGSTIGSANVPEPSGLVTETDELQVVEISEDGANSPQG